MALQTRTRPPCSLVALVDMRLCKQAWYALICPRSGGCGIERCPGPGHLGRQRDASDRRLGTAHGQGTLAARRRRNQCPGASKPASGSLTTNAGSLPNPRPLLTAGARPRTAPDASLTLSRSPRPPNVFDIGSFAFHDTICYTFWLDYPIPQQDFGRRLKNRSFRGVLQ